jgi:hypothetical protein
MADHNPSPDAESRQNLSSRYRFRHSDPVVHFHLFAASELRSYFTDHFDIEDLRGLDLFHNRFAPDPRWNPLSLAVDNQFSDDTKRLEETYATSSGFMERAAHLLLVARRRPASAKSESEPNFGCDTHFSGSHDSMKYA